MEGWQGEGEPHLSRAELRELGVVDWHSARVGDSVATVEPMPESPWRKWREVGQGGGSQGKGRDFELRFWISPVLPSLTLSHLLPQHHRVISQL